MSEFRIFAEINDRTSEAAAEIKKRGNEFIENYLDVALELIKSPASPQPRRDGDRRIIHDEVPTVPWQYEAGGVGRMDGNLASSYEWRKQGDGYIFFSATGYGAYHELGTAFTNPNPAGARAFEAARQQVLNQPKGLTD